MYFLATPDSFLISTNTVVKIKISCTISDFAAGRFILMPVLDSTQTTAKFSDSVLGNCDSVHDLVFSDFGIRSVAIYFKVIDTLTGVVYKTNSLIFYNRSLVSNYLGRINDNLNSMAIQITPETSESTTSVMKYVDASTLSKHAMFSPIGICSVVLLLLVGVFGFIAHLMRKRAKKC
jgi:hypothetical protein